MTKYKIEFTEEVWKDTTIEAETLEEAKEAFWNGDFDEVFITGGEIQDGVTYTEVTE